MIDHDLAAELDRLAEAIARLKPISARNPHAFHEERSELASRARALALRARTGEPIGPADVPAPIGRQAVRHEIRHIDGRTILVLTKSQAHALEHDGIEHNSRCAVFPTPALCAVRSRCD